MLDLKNSVVLFVLTHKKTFVPDNSLFIPVQIGTALNGSIPGYLHDNTGENISDKNKSYCELTGQYWAWKNIDALYYGFYHYRRYLAFSDMKHPYSIQNFPDKRTLNKMGYGSKDIEKIIQNYDIIVPKSENMYETAWQNYARAPYHYAEDLKLMIDILKENYPEYKIAADKYMNGTELYLKNMYIMKKEYFHAYCSWLFPLLEAFDKKNNWNKYNDQAVALRVDGYLSERLFGIWYTYMKEHENIRTCELGRVHFAKMDKKGNLQYMKWINQILPPGTRRRYIIARFIKFILKKKCSF